MSQQEYVTIKGERYDIKRPRDSQILCVDGSSLYKTSNQQEYVTVKGERYEIKRPKDSQIMCCDGSSLYITMNKQEYVTVKGERYEIKRPKDSEILNLDVSCLDRTISKEDFTVKAKSFESLQRDVCGAFLPRRISSDILIPLRHHIMDGEECKQVHDPGVIGDSTGSTVVKAHSNRSSYKAVSLCSRGNSTNYSKRMGMMNFAAEKF
ncbi:hypothetical protein NECAME_05780 [Necator americanus]|uniref:Uncharacterized protein n=1 Tax=Necator americanus TaxID=51031 RepID=W2TZ37_NECAM|nr:hypothetical protein NECAME_05780 [Necator americanus]ETN86934.1 hypothetical protein NECAME_05780 [Necator americanus]